MEEKKPQKDDRNHNKKVTVFLRQIKYVRHEMF